MPLASFAMHRPLRAPPAASKASPASPATSGPSPPSSDLEMSVPTAKALVSASPTALAINLSAVTNSEGKKVFKCAFPGCGREFQLKGNLKRHMNIHSGDKQFTCAWCGRGFLRKADMEVHTRVHTGEKPHACRFPGCDRSFARRSDLLSHERTHSGTKPFECPFPGCGRRFARKFDLHKHQRMHDNASGDMCKPKKRRLTPSTSSSSLSCSSTASSPRASPKSSPTHSDISAAGARSTPTTGVEAIPKGSVARLCIQCGTTSVAPVATLKPAIRYELKCTEDHIHSPPACFAAFNVTDPIDAFLAEDAPDFKTLSLMDLPPPTGPCGLSGHIFAPLPDFKIDEVTPGGPNLGNMSRAAPAYSVDDAAASLEASTLAEATALGGFESTSDSEAFLKPLEEMNLAPVEAKLPLPDSKSPITHALSQPSETSVESEGKALTPVCIPAPTPNELALNYSRHSRSCGHLSIQHGNHRDYVVHNHLVCQDSVKKLGERPRSGSNCSNTATTAQGSAKCAPQDSHGPGCGHLPVRHQDHIDYVVEDNLFCQRAGWLDDVDNIELLDDDFWEFYGAIGSLNTDELKQEQKENQEKDQAEQRSEKIQKAVV